MHSKFLIIASLAISVWLTPEIAKCTDMEESPCFIKRIPVEKQVEIINWLPRVSIGQLASVCIHFRDVIYGFNIWYMDKIKAPYEATDKDLMNLAQKFSNIQTLDLAYNHHITGESIIFLPNLKILCLGQSRNLSDEAIKNLTNLESLNLGDFSSGITNNGVTKLIKLQDLTVGHSNSLVTNQGIRLMTQLKKLTLACNNYNVIDETSLIHLTNLEELSVPTSIKKIHTFAGLIGHTNLTKLHLDNRDHIDFNEYTLLCNNLPNLSITWTYNNSSNPTWPLYY